MDGGLSHGTLLLLRARQRRPRPSFLPFHFMPWHAPIKKWKRDMSLGTRLGCVNALWREVQILTCRHFKKGEVYCLGCVNLPRKQRPVWLVSKLSSERFVRRPCIKNCIVTCWDHSTIFLILLSIFILIIEIRFGKALNESTRLATVSRNVNVNDPMRSGRKDQSH